MKQPIILDCDPGHDDAIALIMALANPRLTVLAVTTSAGNQTLEKTLNNAIRVLTLLNRPDIAVAGGACKPLNRDLTTAADVHGESGLDGPELPPPGFEAQPVRAWELIARKIRGSKSPVTLVPTGPLTNIAIFLNAYPELKSRIERIVLMGGSAGAGNWTAAAEFNIFVDPEAADIVFKSGIPLVMAGLDVTHRAQIMQQDIARISAMPNKVARSVAAMLNFYAIYHEHPRWGFAGVPLHDPCTIAYLLQPELFTTLTCNVAIETKSELTLGMTVVDRYHLSGRPENATVLIDLDRKGFVDLLVDSLDSYQD